MNYGHALTFGTFITPSNSAPQAVVALAQRSETLGYDVVTFQDHPYQPTFLDTWTLMSWVAAQTERIHISGNVLNLPLRQPAVLARSAASLDLLSGGRVSLGIGAGGFWDAIESMGAKRLTTGESVEALSEGIDIIRGVWDMSGGQSLRYAGKHYTIKGMKRGPAPAHDIPIWVGAYKPRMLRLTGQKADGWLPSLGYLKPEDLPAANATIDEAAQEAGRDPREIRRILNISGQFAASNGGFLVGPSKQWVEELLPLVVEHGIGTFILMADNPRVMEQFAQDVIPALRDAASREVTLGSVDEKIRSALVRSKRRDGIDYDAVPASLAATVVEPGDTDYARVKSTYMRGGTPGIVFRVRDTQDIINALAFARMHPDVPLGIRSGGHGISGRSTNNGGIIISLAKLNSIEILDEATRRIRVGAGARWMDVANALAPYGWALSSGDYGGVGVGGLATAGGVGWLARQHGLTIDHLLAVEMVLADGSVVRASATENAELFWGVRGAGANFGIVTSFEFAVDEVGEVGFGQLVLDASNTAEFLTQWGAVVEGAPRDLTSFLIMGAPRRGQPLIAQVMSMVDSNDPDTIISRLQPIASIAPLYDQNVVITSYAGVMSNAQGGDHDGYGEPMARSGLVEHITPEFAAAVQRLMYSGDIHFFQIRSIGGAVSDVPEDATAFAGRSANFHIAGIGANRAKVDAVWNELRPYFKGTYLSFETDTSSERLHEAFPPATLARLRALKLRYDPTNVFRDNFNVAPDVVSVETA